MPISTLLIGYYHGLLLRDLDSDMLTDDMHSTHLLSTDEQTVIDSGYSVHQRNWLLLERVRQMDTPTVSTFCELLQNKWPQISAQLLTGTQTHTQTHTVTDTHTHTHTHTRTYIHTHAHARTHICSYI